MRSSAPSFLCLHSHPTHADASLIVVWCHCRTARRPPSPTLCTQRSPPPRPPTLVTPSPCLPTAPVDAPCGKPWRRLLSQAFPAGTRLYKFLSTRMQLSRFRRVPIAALLGELTSRRPLAPPPVCGCRHSVGAHRCFVPSGLPLLLSNENLHRFWSLLRIPRPDTSIFRMPRTSHSCSTLLDLCHRSPCIAPAANRAC